MRRLFLGCVAVMSLYSSDTLHQEQLAGLRGNKVLLLGSWSGRERSNWERLLADDNLFSVNLQIIDSSRWSDKVVGDPDPKGFESWVRDRFGLGASRWVLLDARNRFLASGRDVPELDDLRGQLARSGFRSPLDQLKTFLVAHPDHLEARADLLREIRRRSLWLCGTWKGRPGPGLETITWAPLAQAVDDLFKTNWRGLPIHFFNPASDQPEGKSPTMKAVFQRHIGEVEAALATAPTSESLWQLWAWMARSLGDRPWKKFLKSLDPFVCPDGPTCPSAEVSLWLTRDAMARQDWETVAELGPLSRNKNGDPSDSIVVWSPSRTNIAYKSEKLSYDPLLRLEALVRLGRIDEANDVFDEALRAGTASIPSMVKLAKTSGNPQLARTWGTAESQPTSCREVYAYRPGVIYLGYCSTPKDGRVSNLVPMAGVSGAAWDALGWKSREDRWALFDGNGRVAAQGWGEPTWEILKPDLDRLGFRSDLDRANDYLRTHPKDPWASQVVAWNLSALAWGGMVAPVVLDGQRDEELWGPVARAWKDFYDGDTICDMPTCWCGSGPLGRGYSSAMNDLASQVLPKIEAFLQQRPTSEILWREWMGWRDLERNKRPIASLMATLEPSPMAPANSVPPREFLSLYLDESRGAGRWPEVIAILRIPWDREVARFDAIRQSDPSASIPADLWETGRALVAALLENGERTEADAVLDAWMNRGGSLSRDRIPFDVAVRRGDREFVTRWESVLSSILIK